ncbi:MAG TPA: hypothetical protein VIV40_20025 [Kofleriaceae bacterium]
MDLQLIAAVESALAETEAEYAQLPFFVRPMVKRGFAKRTGHDFEQWRALLADLRRGQQPPAAHRALAALAEHYLGAPERAKRGMGATAAQMQMIEQRSQQRRSAVLALAAALGSS